MELTKEQIQALETIKGRWDVVGAPQGSIGTDKAVMVHVKSNSTGAEMWLGIEPDGYTHS
jgi:hypothetical protein